MAAKNFVALASVLALAACTPYHSNYGCKGYPEGVACVDMETIYEETNNRSELNQSDVIEHLNGNQDGKVAGNRQAPVYTGRKASNVPGSAPVSVPSQSYHDYPAAPDPTITPDYTLPIRTPATVMRIWVAPWVDSNDDLMMSGYIYSEINKRRWMIGEPTVDGRSSYLRTAPLVPKKSPVEDDEGAETSEGQPRPRPTPR